jgi:hypothetical protein
VKYATMNVTPYNSTMLEYEIKGFKKRVLNTLA